MTFQQWVEGISAGATLILTVLAGFFLWLRMVVKRWNGLVAELRAGVEAVKKQATTAAQQSTAAATSAAKVDDSMHTTNSGSHLRDQLDRIEQSQAGMREELRNLARVDLADREAEAAEHQRMWSAIDRRG